VRPLSLRERSCLIWVLACLSDSVEAEVLHLQTLNLTELNIERGVAVSSYPDGPLPVRAVAYDSENQPVGEVLVWIVARLLSCLEYGWVTDEMPDKFPVSNQLRVVS
jgi:hypothetical protein